MTQQSTQSTEALRAGLLAKLKAAGPSEGAEVNALRSNLVAILEAPPPKTKAVQARPTLRLLAARCVEFAQQAIDRFIVESETAATFAERLAQQVQAEGFTLEVLAAVDELEVHFGKAWHALDQVGKWLRGARVLVAAVSK